MHPPHPSGFLAYGWLDFSVPQVPCVVCKANYPRKTRNQTRCATCEAAFRRMYNSRFHKKWRKRNGK